MAVERIMRAAVFLLLFSFAGQGGTARIHVEEAALRAAASVYPAPEYPPQSVEAMHAGRVVVDIVVAPASVTSALARVRSTSVVEAPDSRMADAVVRALNDARYVPFFVGMDVVEASGRVVWEFRIGSGAPAGIDPFAPARRPSRAPADMGAEDLRIVRRAREILNSEHAWNRADNRQCPPAAGTVSLYCALEKATQEIAGTFEHRGTAMEDARAIIEETMAHREYDHALMGYNNDPATTFADIQRVFQLTEARIAKRIAR